MHGISSLVLREVDRACQHVANNMGNGQILSKLHTYGSHALGASTGATPTTESLLALVVHESSVCGTNLYNPASSLSLAHVTLLNGFVDLSSAETQYLAAQAVEDAVRQSLYCPNVAQSWPLVIGKQSLAVFEYRGDVTNGKF